MSDRGNGLIGNHCIDFLARTIPHRLEEVEEIEWSGCLVWTRFKMLAYQWTADRPLPWWESNGGRESVGQLAN
jgi:hypothetical protein